MIMSPEGVLIDRFGVAGLAAIRPSAQLGEPVLDDGPANTLNQFWIVADAVRRIELQPGSRLLVRRLSSDESRQHILQNAASSLARAPGRLRRVAVAPYAHRLTFALYAAYSAPKRRSRYASSGRITMKWNNNPAIAVVMMIQTFDVATPNPAPNSIIAR